MLGVGVWYESFQAKLWMISSYKVGYYFQFAAGHAKICSVPEKHET